VTALSSIVYLGIYVCYAACHAPISFQLRETIELVHHSVEQWCNDVEVRYIINVSRVIRLISGRQARSRARLNYESNIYLDAGGTYDSDSIRCSGHEVPLKLYEDPATAAMITHCSPHLDGISWYSVVTSELATVVALCPD
jgi:hypothetical protein